MTVFLLSDCKEIMFKKRKVKSGGERKHDDVIPLDEKTPLVKIVKPNKKNTPNQSKIRTLTGDEAKAIIDTLNSKDLEMSEAPKAEEVETIKANVTMDYQRDVCKDFLKNGYCGFGDTCKFLHYREEFKKVERTGEQDWEKLSKRKKY